MDTTVRGVREWMRQADAARELGVTRQRVHQLVVKRRLLSRDFPDIGLLVLREDVARYRKARPR